MKNEYTLYQVGEFWEIFNTVTKTMVYVSESKVSATKTLNDLRKGVILESLLK